MDGNIKQIMGYVIPVATVIGAAYLFIALLVGAGNGISKMDACNRDATNGKPTNNVWQADVLTLGTTGTCIKASTNK